MLPYSARSYRHLRTGWTHDDADAGSFAEFALRCERTPDGLKTVREQSHRVIGAAMEEAGTAGIGRVTLSRRERPVLVEPRDGGMVLITLRAAEEVRTPAFEHTDGEVDPEMVAVAATIIRRRFGSFDPATFRDRYQEALRPICRMRTFREPSYSAPTCAAPT